MTEVVWGRRSEEELAKEPRGDEEVIFVTSESGLLGDLKKSTSKCRSLCQVKGEEQEVSRW